MERLSSSRIAWAPIVSALALGGLLLLTNGCNEAALVDVAFSTGTSPEEGMPTPPPDPDQSPNPQGTATATPIPTPTSDPDNPTPTPTATPDPDNPTPTPTPDPDETPTPTPTPAPTPSLSCGSVIIKDLRITDEVAGPAISYRPWTELELANPNGSSINGLGLAPGTYTRVRFTVHKPTGSGSGGPGTGDPSINHSVHLCGEWNGIAWDYKDDETFDVDRREPNGVVVDGDGPAKLFVIFDSSGWFDGIDLSTLQPAPDGVVYLDHHVNHPVQLQFRDNFRDSVRLANEAYGSH